MTNQDPPPPPPIAPPSTGAAQPVESAREARAQPVGSAREARALAAIVSTIAALLFVAAATGTRLAEGIAPGAWLDRLGLAGAAIVLAWAVYAWSATIQAVAAEMSPNEAARALVAVVADMSAAQMARADEALRQQREAMERHDAAMKDLGRPFAPPGPPREPPPAGPS